MEQVCFCDIQARRCCSNIMDDKKRKGFMEQSAVKGVSKGVLRCGGINFFYSDAHEKKRLFI